MTKDEKAADEWLEQREVLIELPYNKRTVRTAVIKEQKDAFLAGCAHKEKQYQRLMEWAKVTREFLDEVIDHNYFGMNVSDVTQSYDEILKEVGEP